MTKWLILILLIAPEFSTAATFTVKVTGEYKYPTISVQGEISNQDGDKFASLANRYGNALVDMNSPGGSLLSGIQIGTVIRMRAFHTLVRNGNVCASACAYAWLAGTERFVEPGARVGFHAAYVVEKGTAKETGMGNALLGSYLSRIALNDHAIAYFTSAAPEDMNWLNGQTARQLGLNVQLFNSSNKAPDQLTEKKPSSNDISIKTAANSYESESVDLIKKYFTYWSADNQTALEFLEKIFDETVDFYGQPRSKYEIIKEKISMMKRWPARAYIERADSIKVTCDKQSNKCRVDGLIDWEVKSDVRNKEAGGLSIFTFILDFSRGAPKVISESGSVLQRK